MMRLIKIIALVFAFGSTSASADTNDDLSLLIKELQYLEKITSEMEARNSEESPRVVFQFDKFALRLKVLRKGAEAHLHLVQSVPKWNRLGVNASEESN